ncbi:MAG: hypothetical protein CV087_02305 [Candidatus Brocadia sp. WS118]|nr:MAG: hypothetical protein CV087_02305 [Candidatus Brocadia sp. WS118]
MGPDLSWLVAFFIERDGEFMEKQERQIILSDNRIKVSGDFGGGYTTWLPGRDKMRERLDAITRAMIYMPGARMIGITEDERKALGLGKGW